MIRFLSAFVLIAGFVSSRAAADGMQYPLSVAAGPDGAIYVADRDLPGIWKIADGKLEMFFQGSKKFRTPLNAVRYVAVDPKGRVVAADSATREIYRFSAEKKPEPLTNGWIGIPMALAFDSKGDILVCDLELHQVLRLPEAGGQGARIAEVAGPRGIAVDAQDRVWVVDAGARDKGQVLRVLDEEKLETVVEGRPFEMPHHIALDKDENAYICDNYAATVWKVPPGGKPVKWISGKPLVKPVGITLAGDRILIADPHARMIFEATLDGKISPVKFELVK